MTPQELKNSILQLAIQGKLVEQRPEEGTGEELYQQIQEEKQELITVGKIKKEKPLPEIKEEEKPFDLPEGWKWVFVRDCISARTGLAYDKANLNIHSEKMIRILRGGNISEMCYTKKNDDVMISSEFVKSELFLKKNTIITPAVTSLDHVGKMGRIERDYDDMVAGGFVLTLIPHIDKETFSKYLLVTFSSKFFRDCCRNIVNKSGQAFYNLSREKMMQLIIPLPPLAEQKRIVAKIEELLPLIDRYEKAWNRLEEFNRRFPDDLQKSFLQMAIQGKLVEQRPEEGTAEKLYQQIQKEKQELIKAGKSKKEKPLPEITEDEKPFDIPESWKWFRIGELFKIINGFTPLKSNPLFWTNGSIPWFTIEDVHRQGRFITKTEKYITQEALSKNTERIVPPDTVLLCCTASVGEYAYTRISLTTNQQFNALVVKDYYKKIVYPVYIYEYIQTLKSTIIEKAGKTTFNFLSVGKLAEFLVPLPPLAEQHRIVAKLEELLPLCEKMKN